ncbi:MAG TPA: sulfatase-like hydrolase/transferase, partial [Thermoleophilaceae bacterium]|nr:sulfatase-like hydrolase/transferase [Thermoleophilaceae bacterium]
MTNDPAGNQPAAARARSSRRWLPDAKDLLVAWLHLSVLWAFAVARPLFDVLADSPEFFVARGNTSADIVALALVVTLAPPTVLVALEAIANLVPGLRRIVHTIFVAGLAGTLALRLLVDLSTGSSGLLIPIAVVAGVVFGALYLRTRLVPATLTVLSPMPALFIVLFLVFSPVSDLVFPEEIEVASASGNAGNSKSPPVIWVTFDEFSSASLMTPGDRLNADRYPNLARLARDSTWYRDATTVDGSTTVAVPALMSGTYPKEDELPTAADHPGSIFTLLGGSYSMNVTEAATAVCPTDLCGESSLTEDTSERARALVTDLGIVTGHLLLPTDLRRRLPAVDRSFGDFADQGRDSPATGGPPAAAKEIPAGSLARRDQLFERFVGSIKPRPRRPPLHFLHTALPHVPWQYLPSGQQYAVSGPDIPGLTDEQWANDPVLVDQAAQRYLLQVGFADRLIGRLLRRLRETGLYDRSLIVVTADHGVSFQPGGPRRGSNPD